jgi:Zn-dependent protease with chaperone function
MKHEEISAHIQKIEKRFAGRPAALRARLLWLAALGYAGMFAWLGVVILLAACFLVPGILMPLESGWLLLLIGSLILTFGGWAAARVLWVRLTPPEGRAVSRREAPALYAMLDGLRRRLRASGFYRVIITTDCNAAVSEIPRLGVFGWPRHYLQFGLPLLECLSAEEVRAVLAHEYAHLSARHGWINGWIYRQRRSWEQIFEKLRQPRSLDSVSLRPILVKFIDWFWPRFNAHAWVLSRANEFQADAAASWAAGPQFMASALFRLDVYHRLLNQRFWPDLWQRANAEPAPPSGVFEDLRNAVRAEPPEEAAKWREQAFKFVTSKTDTHPCLSARLKAIKQLPEGIAEGHFPPWPPVHEPNAAETLFGPALGRIRKDVEARWQKDCRKAWAERHARAFSLQHRLQALSEATPDPGSDVDSLWDQARAIGALQGDLAAAPILRQIIALRPDHVGANFHLGRCLIEAGDDAGESHLERVMEEDEESAPQACALLHAHYRRMGRVERVREIEARLDRHETTMTASKLERATVTSADTIVPHECNGDDLETLRSLLEAEPDVTAAYLGRKQMQHFRKQRLFVLCVAVRRAWHHLPNRSLEQAVVRRLFSKIRLSGRVLVCSSGGSHSGLARKLRAIPHTLIFQRR